MVAVTSPLSPRGLTATLAVTYHRAEVSCISVTWLTRLWNMMECTYGLCVVILDSTKPLLYVCSEASLVGVYMARCTPKCEKTMQALLCRNLNVKLATLVVSTGCFRAARLTPIHISSSTSPKVKPLFSDSHVRDLMKSYCPLSSLLSSFAGLLVKEFSCRRRKSSRRSGR